jgi:hypothetical protein
MKRGERHEGARRSAIRQRIAAEAGRLLATRGVADAREAIRRAARIVGESGEQAWPTHEEVLEKQLEYQRLFLSGTQPDALRRLRDAAIEAMEFLAGFEPRVYGAVLDGSADEGSPVRLQVFSEDPEGFAHFLADQGWPVEAFDLRVVVNRELTERFPARRFDAGGVPFEIVALPPELLRQAPLDADGKPMARASLTQLKKIGSEPLSE